MPTRIKAASRLEPVSAAILAHSGPMVNNYRDHLATSDVRQTKLCSNNLKTQICLTENILLLPCGERLIKKIFRGGGGGWVLAMAKINKLWWNIFQKQNELGLVVAVGNETRQTRPNFFLSVCGRTVLEPKTFLIASKKSLIISVWRRALLSRGSDSKARALK